MEYKLYFNLNDNESIYKLYWINKNKSIFLLRDNKNTILFNFQS